MLGNPSSALAQSRMPHKDAGAIGGEVGVFLPRQDGMTTGPMLEGYDPSGLALSIGVKSYF